MVPPPPCYTGLDFSLELGLFSVSLFIEAIAREGGIAEWGRGYDIGAQVTKGAFPLNASGNASDGSSNDGSSIEVLKDQPTVRDLGFRV